MEAKEVLKHVDHTLLKPYATWEDMKKLCEEAVKYHMASVCVPPCYIRRIKEAYKEKINVCTVVGFPLGYCVTDAKLAETKQAIEDGAEEIDMVINLCDVKNGDFHKIKEEISALKKVCGNRVLKVIVETCYLNKEEKIALCEIVTEAGADYIKTSTGFGTAGASLEDIHLFKEHIGAGVKIKAAGGIRTKEDMVDYLEAGCDRIGTSSDISVLLQE